jgi:hypothetical protein
LGAERTSAPIESGEETIEINGKRLATRWQSASYRYDADALYTGCSLIVKVWTSDAVPTGLIRKTEDKTCPVGPGRLATRIVFETYLESFGGFTPAVRDSSGPVTTAYVPPPAAPSQSASPSVVTPAPVTKPVPTAVEPQQNPLPPRPPPPRTVTPPVSPPDVAAQMELLKRYGEVMGRAERAKQQLAQLERKQGGQGTQLSAGVSEARDRLDTQLRAVILAISKRDNAQTEQRLQSAEDALAVVESYLKQ